jgi:hypothetical protein
MDSRVKDRGKPGTAPVLLSQARSEMRHPNTKTLARARLHELSYWQHSTLHQRSASHARRSPGVGWHASTVATWPRCPNCDSTSPLTSSRLLLALLDLCYLLSALYCARLSGKDIYIYCWQHCLSLQPLCARTTTSETSDETSEDRLHPSTHPGSDTTSALSPATTIQERVRPHPYHVYSLPRASKPPNTGNIQYII